MAESAILAHAGAARQIVPALGPARESQAVIEKLLEPGVDGFRLNASHGTREEHPATIRTGCQIARWWGRDAAILPGFEGP